MKDSPEVLAPGTSTGKIIKPSIWIDILANGVGF